MAASGRDEDYVHVLANILGDSTVGDAIVPIDFSAWEIQARDRVETYAVIDPYLVDTPKLVIIQLGESVTDAETFEHDLEEFVRHVQEKCRRPRSSFWVISGMAGLTRPRCVSASRPERYSYRS